MKKKLAIIAFILLWPSVGWATVEEFYICHGGDGTLPQSGICAYSWDEADYAVSTNWQNSDSTANGKIGWGDSVLLLDDGGKLTRLTTPITGNKFTIKAAIGESPIIHSDTGWALIYGNAGKSELVIGPGITFEDWETGSYGVRIVEPISFRITGNYFTKADATTESFGIGVSVGNTSSVAINGAEIDDNQFNLNYLTHAIQYTMGQTTALNRPGNMNTHHNGFYNVRTGERHFLAAGNQAYVLENGLIPYNVKFDDNYGDHSQAALFAPMAGMSEDGGTSSVSRNMFDYCGVATQDDVNCLQIFYSIGADILNNRLTHVNTQTCDGYFIILDFAGASDSYLSSGNNVKYNFMQYADSICGGSTGGGCISAYKAVDNNIDYNVCLDAPNGAAFRAGSNESTGNVFANNTAARVNVCWSQADADNIGVAATFINGLCDSPYTKGFSVLNNSPDPTENNNLIYNAPTNDITLDMSDSTTNPHLNSNGRPTSLSPDFIKFGGTLVDGITLLNPDRTAPVGAYGWRRGNAGIPGKPMFTSFAGYTLLGSGTVYSSPAGTDYFLLLESGDYFLLESGDKLILE